MNGACAEMFYAEMTLPKILGAKMVGQHPDVLDTLYNTILRTARNFLETRENVKISTHPFYHINLGWFSWEWSKKKLFFFEKKIQNGRLKKSSFFKIANSQKFFAKISQIRPWVSTMVPVSTVQPSKVSMWLHGFTRVFFIIQL